jgi:two-component system chemotaxis sensor kinase CheA
MTLQPGAMTAFVQEARELLAAMETLLLQMEIDGVDKNGIDAVFRAVHTIKGSAAIFELEHIVSFTHLTESVLDRVRNGSCEMDDTLRTLLIECSDYVSSLIDAIDRGDGTVPDDVRREQLDNRLGTYLVAVSDQYQDGVARHGKQKKKKASANRYQKTGIKAQSMYWHISLRLNQRIFYDGINPIGFIQHLATLGSIIALRVVDQDLPVPQEMDPELCYLGFEIVMATDARKKALHDIFELIEEDITLAIIAPHSDIGAYRAVVDNFNDSKAGMLLLADMHVLNQQECSVLANVIDAQSHPEKQEGHIQRDVVEQQFIKIDVAQLDYLIDVVGELVIAGATASLVAKIKRDQQFQEMTRTISDLVEKIRDTALVFRMVKIHDIFQRVPRLIRETARELDKEIDLVMTGDETELDKSMMEKISIPLMHLVRNAIDHGIEKPEIRRAQGKPAKGKISLHAKNESGSIVIEISDDGKGIDYQKVLDQAVKQGIYPEGYVLSDAEAQQLIFMPGFSTAEEITEISGRGVGMDVVKRQIEQLHGNIVIQSTQGRGTSIRLRLPMTLAIISGFQVIVGDMVFVVPLDVAVECINLGHYAVSNHIVTLRGEPLTFIDMRALFDMPLREMERKNVLVVQYAGHRIGLLVDELQGECQAVVKPLSKLFVKMRGFSGSAVLGDGRIALILDVAHLVDYARQAEQDALIKSE